MDPILLHSVALVGSFSLSKFRIPHHTTHKSAINRPCPLLQNPFNTQLRFSSGNNLLQSPNLPLSGNNFRPYTSVSSYFRFFFCFQNCKNGQSRGIQPPPDKRTRGVGGATYGWTTDGLPALSQGSVVGELLGRTHWDSSLFACLGRNDEFCSSDLEVCQTYDRFSITRWMEEGHCTCPKTGQTLIHTRLVPNRALRNLIMQWCTAHGVPYNPPEGLNSSSENFAAPSASKAAIEANKATSQLLIQQLANESHGSKTVAAREIRLLAKTGRENRAYIAEAGAVPHLKALFSSPNAVAQENSVTVMLNLSIYEKN